MSKSILHLFLLILILPGCATLLDRKQLIPLSCSTEDCQVSIPDQGLQATAPVFLKVDREDSLQIEYKSGDQTIRQKVKAEVRFSESVIPNAFLYVIGGPVLSAIGFGVDYWTKSMYEFPNPEVAQFKKPKSNQNTSDPQRIVILPPVAKNPFLSDEAVNPLLSMLKKRYPRAEVIVPEINTPIFARYNFTYDNQALSIEKQNQFFHELNTQYVVYSEVKGSKKRLRLQYEIYDLFRRKPIETESLAYQSQIDGESKESWILTQAAQLIPTGVGLSRSTKSVSGVGEYESNSQGFSASSFLNGENQEMGKYIDVSGSSTGKGDTQVYSLSLNNFDSNIGESNSVAGKWSSDFSFNYTKYHIAENSVQYSMTDGKVVRTNLAGADHYSLSAMIGPELGINGFAGYFFLNTLLGIESSYVQISNNKSFVDLQVPVDINMGWRLKPHKNWLLGFILSARFQSQNFMQKIVDESVGANQVKAPSATIGSFTINLTYHIPETKKMGRRYLQPIAKR